MAAEAKVGKHLGWFNNEVVISGLPRQIKVLRLGVRGRGIRGAQNKGAGRV
jgi:hypothetical protein